MDEYTNKLTNLILYKIAIITDPQNSYINYGPKIIPLNILINIHKGGTIIFILLLMLYYNNYSLISYIYLSLHGSYGIIWILKDYIIPDKTFQIKVSIPVALLTQIVLLIYWSFGILIIINNNDIKYIKILICFLLYILGVFLMIGTDIQKNITLKYKKGLINNLFLYNNRNTNYLGEILIYLSFGILVNNILIYLILIGIWITLFGSRIYLKEISLSKKEGFKEYKNRSYILLFKIFNNDYYNYILYIIILIILIYIIYYI